MALLWICTRVCQIISAISVRFPFYSWMHHLKCFLFLFLGFSLVLLLTLFHILSQALHILSASPIHHNHKITQQFTCHSWLLAAVHWRCSPVLMHGVDDPLPPEGHWFFCVRVIVIHTPLVHCYTNIWLINIFGVSASFSIPSWQVCFWVCFYGPNLWHLSRSYSSQMWYRYLGRHWSCIRHALINQEKSVVLV